MTEQTQPDPTGTVISADDQRAIRVAMNAVPYAADLRVPIPPRGDLSARDGRLPRRPAGGADRGRRTSRRSAPASAHPGGRRGGVPPPHRHRARRGDLMSAHIEWLAARETSVQVFTPGEDWVGAGEHRQPVLTLAGDDVVAIQGTPAELRALAARITAVATAASGRLDLAAREDQPA